MKQTFNGIDHSEIPKDECAKGDYIVYYDRGYRVGKVKKIQKGRLHRWIHTEKKLYNDHVLEESRKVDPRKVISAWRNTK